MGDSLLSHVDAVAASGKAVVSADDDTVVALVKKAIESDQSVSFYLTRSQARAIREWYWTPERTRVTGIRPVSPEEDRKIKSELELNVTNFRYAPLECECGHVYGAYDFLAQGIRQHGLEGVKAVFSLTNSTFFQVNPRFVPVCPACERELPMMRQAGGGWYDCEEYGGCCCCANVFERVPLSHQGAQ
jgi:hypothetical protein